jgi:hypothetical protein
MYCQQVFYFTCNLYRGARPTSQCQNWRRADFDCSQWLQLWAFWSNRGLFSIMAKLYIMFKCFSLNFISLWFFLVSGCWQQNNRGFIYQRALPRARALRAVPTCACTKKRKLSWQSLILDTPILFYLMQEHILLCWFNFNITMKLHSLLAVFTYAIVMFVFYEGELLIFQTQSQHT